MFLINFSINTNKKSVQNIGEAKSRANNYLPKALDMTLCALKILKYQSILK